MFKIVFSLEGGIELTSLSEQGFRNIIAIFVGKPFEWEVLIDVNVGRRITGLILDMRRFKIVGEEGCSLFYMRQEVQNPLHRRAD